MKVHLHSREIYVEDIRQKRRARKTAFAGSGGPSGRSWVGELSRCWESELQRTAAAAIVVRLANVSFVDETGTELLRKMFQAGAKLEGSGCMVRALIAQITGAAFPSGDCEEESKKRMSVESGVGAKGE